MLKKCLLILTLLLAPAALAQSFTYQGKLVSSGVPATTSHDFIFRVYDAASAGTQLGSATTVLDLLPENGLFTATVNPGTNVFTGPDRWLEVAVRRNNVGNYVTLVPRQKISAAPYALMSLSDRWTELGNGRLTNSSQVSSVYINRTTPVTGADYFNVRTPTGQQAFGGMYIDTAAGDGLPFYGYSTGNTVRGYSYIDGTTGAWYLNVNGGNRLTVDGTGRVGMGTTPSGSDRLQVAGTVRVTSTTTASDFTYTAPQTRYLMIGAEDFHAGNSAQPGEFGQGANFRAALDPSVGFGEIVAPVHLPDGAQITEVLCYMSGPNTTNPLNFALQYRLLTNLNPVNIALADTLSGSGFGLAATFLPANNTPINNSDRSYHIRVSASDWTSSHFIRHVRIAYTVPKPD